MCSTARPRRAVTRTAINAVFNATLTWRAFCFPTSPARRMISPAGPSAVESASAFVEIAPNADVGVLTLEADLAEASSRVARVACRGFDEVLGDVDAYRPTAGRPQRAGKLARQITETAADIQHAPAGRRWTARARDLAMKRE